MISGLADGLVEGVERLGGALVAPFSDTVLRLGVTGLSRAGKTVFITSLVANLLDRGRMGQFRAQAAGRIEAVWLQPQPDDAVARFPYEDHLAALTAPEPHWPEGTRRISQLRLSFRVQPPGWLTGWTGPRRLHLDIVDYPGEWLLDLGLMEVDFAGWSDRVLARLASRREADGFRAALAAEGDLPAPRGGTLEEGRIAALARAYTAYLIAARAAGWSDVAPGRFLVPGDLEGSPVLTFAPLPLALRDTPLGRESARRFAAYKARVVRPFFRDHFARIDRQIVLVDVLAALEAGPAALEDLREAMADTLRAFRPGEASWLTRLLGGRRVSKILFAATKADHLHHSQHARLAGLAEALLREARDRAAFAGAETAAMAIASLRTTVEETLIRDGAELGVVRGRMAGTGRQTAFHPGTLPADPAALLMLARTADDSGTGWPPGGFRAADFAPVPLTLRPGEGPPHLRLDRAAEFLFGDRL